MKSKPGDKRRNPFERFTAEERAALAKERMKRVVDHMLHLIDLRANNEVILYSDILVSQIPTSYAAATFNLFRDTSYRYEVVRLCALWDAASADRESIPSVVALIDSKEVRRLLACDAYQAFVGKETYFLNPSEDPDILEAQFRMSRNWQEEHGRREVRKTLRGLQKFSKDALAVSASREMVGLRAHRNNHMAHSLKASPSDVASMNDIHYGAEKRLFEQTLAIVHSAYLWINGADFIFDDSVQMARRNALELWENCTFSIQSRRSRLANDGA